MTNAPQIHVSSHPLVQHNLAVLRDKATGHEAFRGAARRIGTFLIQEATRDLSTIAKTVQTPVADAQAQVLSPDIPLLLIPILRAGLMLVDVATDLLPSASVYHMGLYRDEETLRPVTYYNKLPPTIDYGHARVLILDPMLATGGSAIAAMDIAIELGVRPENVTFVCMIAAPEGIGALTSHYPTLRIVAAAVDEKLNEKAYIVPGLGDAGDRCFGTMHT